MIGNNDRKIWFHDLNNIIYIFLILFITLAGTPTATRSLGISCVTTAPAPMTDRAPMVTPGRTITPVPRYVADPIITRSSRVG